MLDFLKRNLEVGQYVIYTGVESSGFNGVGKVESFTKTKVRISKLGTRTWVYDKITQKGAFIDKPQVVSKDPGNVCIVDSDDVLVYLLKKD